MNEKKQVLVPIRILIKGLRKKNALPIAKRKLKDANKEISQLKEQLKSAREIIEFYGDGMNWNAHPIDVAWNNIINDNDCEHALGGKRAREYLERDK